jgi:hypothetical protein
MFSSLAVQVHYGDAIKQGHVHWHADWANSLLHLGMAVGRGHRGLHRRCPTKINVTVEEDMVEWLTPGDSYVSSPKFFDHGVEFSQIAGWDDRIIAVQSRMISSPQQHQSLLASSLNEKEAFVMLWTKAMEDFSDILVALPTVEEVMIVLSRFKKYKHLKEV